MYSGKTSRIIELYKQYSFCNIPVVAINHILDCRYDKELICSHDHKKIPCIRLDNLSELMIHYKPLLTNTHVVLINEGQFFPDLKESVIQLLKMGKQIHISGLDGDFKREKFGQILDLIPLCDNVVKLTSLCSMCRDGTVGIFSKRTSFETEQTVVGSTNYLPVCRRCYDK